VADPGWPASRPAPARLPAPGQVTARRAVLALGSNLGDRLAHLRAAVVALADTPSVDVIAISPVYETEPVGGPTQPLYLNAVIVVATQLSAAGLLERGHAIELACGRVRRQRWGPRTLDVDLIVCDDQTSDDPALTLPHPRAHERGFVLRPWHDVDPDAVLPGRGRVEDLLTVIGAAGVRRRDDLKVIE
jgi:2-amino-4-hydroxy-6-hydroxymethyldihydropteridine diphosphokinase